MKFFVPALLVGVLSGLASLALPPGHLMAKRATVTALEQDLSLISADLAVLSDSISAVPTPGGNINDLIPVGINAILLGSNVLLTTKDFQGSSTVNPVDAVNILTKAENLQAQIISTISQLVAKQQQLEALIPGAALVGFQAFKNLASDLVDAMIAVAPTTIPPSTISGLRTGLDNAFESAITTFGGSA